MIAFLATYFTNLMGGNITVCKGKPKLWQTQAGHKFSSTLDIYSEPAQICDFSFLEGAVDTG